MTLEVVVGGGLVAILGIVAAAVVLVVQARRREVVARGDLARAQAVGALPVSLHPKVDVNRCIGSGTCVDACPEKDVLAVLDGKARIVNPTSCIGHGECLRACPVDAIQLVIGSERRGVDIPLVSKEFETNVPGLYIVGELGGMGLVYNATTQALQCVSAIRKSPPAKVDGVHQLVVVGAGPAGLAATLSAMEGKLDVVLVDQDTLGGTVTHYPRHKLVMTKPVTLPLYGKLRIGEIQKEDLLAIWDDVVKKTGLKVRERVKVDALKKGDDGVFTLQTSEGPIRAQRVVLALGRRGTPRKLGIPGEDTAKVTYRLVDPDQYVGKRVLVVGGGNAGVEAALALAEAGAATVHLAHRSAVFEGLMPKNQKKIDAAAAEGKVTTVMAAATKEIHPDRVDIEVGGAITTIPNDYVLVFAGGILPTKFLEDAGVKVEVFKGELFAPAN